MSNHLMHQHSGIPAPHYADPAGHGRLQRSLTAHPAVNAAAAANDSSTNLNELGKQLAFMQLMQGGRADASGPLGDLDGQSMEQLLGLAQLQQHQAAAAAAAAAVTAGLDLGRLLPVASSGYGHTTDGSLSCPLPPVFGGGALGQGGVGMHALTNAAVTATASCNPAVPTAPGASFLPHSPKGSDGGRDAPSPMGAGGRDTQVPAPSKKAARWSAPVSPSSSTRGGNDLAAADDVKASGQAGGQQLSSSASSTSSAGGGEGRLRSIPSDHLARGLSGNLRGSLHQDSLSFSAGMGGAGLSAAGVGGSADAGSALLMIGDSPLAAAQVHAALSGGLDAAALGQQQAHGMGKEKAAQLLAQLPEDAVQKLLALVQQGGQ
jgi:hypothetical protein